MRQGSGFRSGAARRRGARLGLVVPAVLVGALGRSGALAQEPQAAGAPWMAPGGFRVMVLRGLYLPAGKLVRGPSEREWDAWLRAGLNAVVVDLKNDQGWVLARLAVPEVARWGASWSPGLDLAGLAAGARAAGFYPVARIVALKDDRATRARPDLALHTRSGTVWQDASGQRWLDPRLPEVRRYVAALARAAADLGFAEVHLDYVRLPSEGPLHLLAWPASDSRTQAVDALVSEVARALAPTGVPLSVAVFGQTCVVDGDMGIGQRCEGIAAHADVVSPMAYPSHYARGSFGLSLPERHPGPTVERTLAATARRIDVQRVRPWLQAFTLRVPYGAAELAAQIEAAEAAGTAGWFLWNPGGSYPYLQTAMELARRIVARASDGAPSTEAPASAGAGAH